MGNRLLLADDSITIQKVVAIIFANEEFELTVVDNGIAALQQAQEIRPDVMLVDALMPGKSGYEVCAEIRRNPALSATPILLLIGAFEPFDEEKARSCGADASITKPFESQQLIDRVKELLELGQSRATAPVVAPAAPAAPVAAPVAAAPVAPVAGPVLLESAAEELWGDLSAFDTMPPPVAPSAPAAPAAAAPAAPAAPAASAPAAATAPAAPAPFDPFAASAFTAAPPSPVTPPPAAPAFTAAPAPAVAAAAPVVEEIEEANFEDDLWGAFDLDEVPKAVAPAAGALGAVAAEPEFEAEEFFSFEDESEVIEETGPALDFAVAAEQPVLQPSPEELFSFADEEAAPVSLSQPDPYSFPVEEPYSFEPEVEAPTAPFDAPPAFTVPAAPSAPPPVQEAPVRQPEEPPVQAAAQPATFALSEADLVAALSRISREVIERIVWEVVPDLAEVLIKEEIRKLKAGIKG
jgi:CheY-like chemotaxis protein